MNTALTTIPTDEVIDIVTDVIDPLDLYIDGEEDLHTWITARRRDLNVIDPADMPTEMRIGDAAQAIADIVASHISHGDEELVDAAMWEMATNEGWRFDAHNVVLWTRYSGLTVEEADRVIVWLGNERDYDMTRIGTAEIKY
jgi:hypothetical protein